MPMTPDEVAAAADARYPGDVYDDTEQRVFAWLVDTAAAIEDAERGRGTDPVHARLMLFKALEWRLSRRDGSRRQPLDSTAKLARAVFTEESASAVFGRANAEQIATIVGELDPATGEQVDELADIAAAYEHLVTADRADPDPGRPVSLAEAGGLTARVTTLLGLWENLEMRDGAPLA